MHRRFRVALVQLMVSRSKPHNLETAAQKVEEAARNGADMVVLPECFNSPYGTSYFSEYAEPLEGPTSLALSNMARSNKVYIIGGSFPELSNSKLFNTCTVWNPLGVRIGFHRKLHLFDIDVPGGIKFKESDSISAGDTLTIVQTSLGLIGIGICYDMRFPEVAMIAARKGCIAMVYPGAFNMTTGPLHWELLQRGRAIDNQMYVAACSPARDTSSSYVAWGHSSVVDPMGVVVSKAGEGQEIIYADIDPQVVHTARQAIPVTFQRRFDVYPDVADNEGSTKVVVYGATQE